MANASQVCVAELFYPGAGIEQFGNPNLTDPLNIRVPDIAVRVVPGENLSASQSPSFSPSLEVVDGPSWRA